MSLSTILKKAVYSSSQEMQAMQPYIAVKDGYAKGGQNFIYQVPIPNSDWTLIGVASLEGLQMLQSQLLYSFIGLGLLALIMCLIGIGFCSAFVDQTLTRPSDYHFEDWSRRCSRESCSQRISRIGGPCSSF